MGNKEAERLIVENIQMLDDSFTVANSVEESIFIEINNFIKESVGAKEFAGEWFGDYEPDEESDLWFAPKTWQVVQEDCFDGLAAYFLVSRAKSDAEDHWSLTSLFPSGKSSYGFQVVLDRAQFQQPPTVKELKKFALTNNQKNSAIEKSGFKFYPNEGVWFLPFTLDVKQVAENYVSDNLVDAFVPITDALKKLQEAHPHFVSIIEDAKKAFSGLVLED